MYLGNFFASKHRFGKNLTVVLKSTQQLLFISNFFDKIRKMVTKKTTNKNNIQFFVSPVKSEVTRIWHDIDVITW